MEKILGKKPVWTKPEVRWKEALGRVSRQNNNQSHPRARSYGREEETESPICIEPIVFP